MQPAKRMASAKTGRVISRALKIDSPGHGAGLYSPPSQARTVVNMNERPRSVTAIGCIFIVAGVIGLAYHGAEFKAQRPFDYDIVWVLLVRLLAILGGVFLLRGSDWARWLLLIWIAYHVILSAFHSMFEVIMHGLLFAVIAYFLYRPRVSAYFRDSRAGAAHPPGKDDTPAA